VSAAQHLSLTRLRRDREYLEFLVQVGEILDSSLDYNQTLGNVCQAAVQTIADISFVVLGRNDLQVAAGAHRDPAKTEDILEVATFVRSNPDTPAHPLNQVLRTKSPVLIPQITEAHIQELARGEEHAAFMRRMEYASLMILPLNSRTQGMLGVMTLIRTGTGAIPYDEGDLRFAGDLARRCASAIAKSMMHTQTLNIATRFQQSALPARLPKIDGITFDAFYEPSSEELLVGGDWYDAFQLPDARVAITIGDVLGHGIDAAVWMGRLRNALRAAMLSDPDPARALGVADHIMRLDSRDEFSTALIAIVDPAHHTIACASAGHPGPLIWTSDGNVTDPFYERRVPLGVATPDPARMSAQVLTLRAGSFAVFFTDGLLEWNRDLLGAWTSLTDAMRRRDVRESAHPAQAIRDAVIGEQKHQDDVAILTLRVDEA